MAFCEYCGRELKDGEICSCSKKNTQFDEMGAKVKEETGKAVGNMITLATAVIASPADAVEAYVSGQDKKSAYQLIAVETVVVTLFDIIYRLMRVLFDGYHFTLSVLISAVIYDVVLVIVVMAVAAFTVTFMADRYGNTKIDFNKGLAIASLQSIIVTPAYIVYRVLTGFCVSILSGLANVIYNGGFSLALILTYFGFSVVVKDRKKLFYGIGIYVVVLRLVAYLIGRIF